VVIGRDLAFNILHLLFRRLLTGGRASLTALLQSARSRI
jgi:hypothetical protein